MGSMPNDSPYGIELGSVLVSLLEPVRGREVAFDRWYERDHFYAGCMVGPHFYSGRRFVATRPLKDLRFPAQSPIVDPVDVGSYLALYFIEAHHHDDALAFAVPRVNWLNDNGRMLPDRTQAHAGFYGLDWAVFRDDDGVPAELALDHPFEGVVLMMTELAEGASAGDLERWVREEHLPKALQGSNASMCLGLNPFPLPADAPSYVRRIPGLERCTLHMYFLQDDPGRCWDDLFARQGDAFGAKGLGRVTFAAPFIPTIPGTDRYSDELW